MSIFRFNHSPFASLPAPVSLRITRLAAAAVLLVGVATAAVGWDVGANVNSASSHRGTDPTFRNTLSGFFRHNPVIEGPATGRFIFESSLTSIVRGDDGEFSDALFFDVDLLQLEGIFPDALGAGSLFRTTVGRIPLSEPTGLVFSDRVDGTSFTADFPRLSLALGGGSTGWLAGGNSAVAMSAEDEADIADADVRTGAKRLVGTASVNVPELFGRNNLSAGVLAQWDQRPFDEIGDKIDSQYFFVGLDGPLGADLYYEAATALSYEQRSQPDDLVPGEFGDPDTGVGLGARVRTEYYIGGTGRNILTAEVRYGSADSDTLVGFLPVTGVGLDLLESPDPNDLTLLMLDYALRPFAGEPGARSRSLEASFYAAANFTATPGQAESYRGSELGSRLTYRPLSDLGLRLWFGGFIPGDRPEDTEFLGRLDLSTSF